ncbi:thiamine pyrophosphate-binding protein [Nitriliruptoraceae bacterium ZYF776]|nr:thiamine pyrophosphate-binding protein [Profundirhabdus halotolerans]
MSSRPKLTGGALIARALKAEGVTRVFGIIDGTYFGLYHALADAGIELVSPRHETTAAHMAGAYARLTGNLGVVMASNGPGVANVLPGVVVEQGEGNRVLLLTSSRRAGISAPDRGGTYQCFDQVAVTRPTTKWAEHVPSRDRLGELLRHALRAVHDGRPGVVHLDVPEDLINGAGELDLNDARPASSYRSHVPLPPDADQVRAAADLLANAQRPLLHAGSGVHHADAEAELAELAALLGAPVTTSWAGRATIVESDPHAVPMVHVDLVDQVRNACDAVLVLGSRLGETDWWGKAPNWASPDAAPTVQVDHDPAVLGATRRLHLAVRADVKLTLRALIDELATRGPSPHAATRTAWRADIADARRADRAKLDEALTDDRDPLHPARIPTLAQEVLPDDTVWVFDGGNTAVWANFFHEVRRPRSLLSTFKFGMLGAGMGQALGAKVAAPDRPVCCLIGDGAFGMHPQEVETAVRHGLAVVWVVFVDQQWGMVKMSQSIAAKPLKTVARKLVLDKALPEGDTVYADFAPIRYDELARSMGAHGEHVSSPAALRDALARCAALDGPSVIHAEVDRGAHLWAPGLRTFKKMHEEPAG